MERAHLLISVTSFFVYVGRPFGKYLRQPFMHVLITYRLHIPGIIIYVCLIELLLLIWGFPLHTYVCSFGSLLSCSIIFIFQSTIVSLKKETNVSRTTNDIGVYFYVPQGHFTATFDERHNRRALLIDTKCNERRSIYVCICKFGTKLRACLDVEIFDKMTL